MNYLALYRKYRPETFDQVIGQDHIVNTLKNQIVNDKISHAYLFCGTRGTGKTSTAKILARAVNCKNNQNGNPCLKCDACKIPAANNMDIVEMDAASNNGVDYARDMREKVQYQPSNSRFKVYIIDEVHMLSQGAFNALLKTLEEPPPHAVFILCTTESHKIPATILSRCMRFDFRLVATELLSRHISEIYDKEGKEYTKEAVNAIAVAGEGSVRDSLSIADRCFSICEGKLTYDDVLSVLGATSSAGIASLAERILLNNAGEILTEVNTLTSGGKDVGRLNRDLTKYFRDLLIVKTCANPNSILCLPSEVFKRLEKSAESASTAKLLYSIDTLSRLEADLRFALSPQLLFEAIALRVAKNSGEIDPEGILKRLNFIEQNLDKASPSGNLVVVDPTNFQSIWLAVKQEISRLNKPLLLALWKEIDGSVGGRTVTLNCTQSQFNLIEMEFKIILADILKRLAGFELKLNLTKTQNEADLDSQLKALGDNVTIS